MAETTSEQEIKIIYAPGTVPLEAGKRKYFGVENLNAKGKHCMINTIPKEVMNEVQRIRTMTNDGVRAPISTIIPLSNFTIELDRYNNIWYYRTRGGKKTLVWRVFSSLDGELSFEYYQSNAQINPWMVNFHKQKELFYLEKNNKKGSLLIDDLSDD